MSKTAAVRRPMLRTLQQIAAESGVPYTSVRDLVIGGRLPRVQLGDSRRIWVKQDDWDRLIAGATVSVEGQ